MVTPTEALTAEDVLISLGFPDPLAAARQQARMILLGRLARYQAEIQRFESKWRCTLEELRKRYAAQGVEDFETDDDYLQWQWYSSAAEAVIAQLAVITSEQ